MSLDNLQIDDTVRAELRLATYWGIGSETVKVATELLHNNAAMTVKDALMSAFEKVKRKLMPLPC